jgi:hypothetical protein
LRELEEAEQRYKRQEEVIKDMRIKYNLKKSDFNKRRSLILHPKSDSDLDALKLLNPPRLFVKINQILKKKKC